MDDLEELLHPGGALDTLERLQAKGLVKALGVGCDADPAVLARAIAELPVAVVRLPVNPAEGAAGGFAPVMAAAREQGLGLVGSRALDGGRLVQAGLDPARLLAYAFAQPVDVLRVGARTPDEVAALVAAAAAPMDEAACRAFEDELRPRAGQLLTYRALWGPAC
jgi:aryl-alcohol dehydrogenase-like predicted oxidoreductase